MQAALAQTTEAERARQAHLDRVAAGGGGNLTAGAGGSQNAGIEAANQAMGAIGILTGRWEEQIQRATERAVELMRRTQEVLQGLALQVAEGVAMTLSDALGSAFETAFSGGGMLKSIAAFGKAMLAGVGTIFVQLGQQYLKFGLIMKGLAKLLPEPLHRRLCSGRDRRCAYRPPGTALQAVAHSGGAGGGGGGGGSDGSTRDPRGAATSERQ